MEEQRQAILPGQKPANLPEPCKRNIGLCVLLSILTCGTYGMYWMIQLNDESQIVSNETGTSGWVALLLSIFTCGIYFLYWNYRLGERLDKARTLRGNTSGNLAIVYLLLAVFGLGLVSYCLAQNELNKYATL